ncbi:PAS domain S-box protein [Oceanidesulfovibrio marinus]|uniref:histidine kinase n=2 Tax=Oceanidesulfovibrio marinus TaxID=370038 RepID=A0ABX6NK83_9BACT|nr:PAS domain S-box protein [Oceanidesulfovibrio marinus]
MGGVRQRSGRRFGYPEIHMTTKFSTANIWQITIALATLLFAVTGLVCYQQSKAYEAVRSNNVASIAELFTALLEQPGHVADRSRLHAIAGAFLNEQRISGIVLEDAGGGVIYKAGHSGAGEASYRVPLGNSADSLAPGGALELFYDQSRQTAALSSLGAMLLLGNVVVLVFFQALMRLVLRRQHKAESLLEQQEERLRLALEASADGIWEYNILDNSHFLSDRMYSMLGFEPGNREDGWRFLFRRVHLEDREKVSRTRKLMEGGLRETLVTRFRMERIDGEWRHILCRAKVVAVDMSGKPARIAGTFTDVSPLVDAQEALANLNRELEERVEQRTTALAQKAEELAEANRQLRELDQLKSSFLSSVSHELRTPLTSILGFARLIDKEFVNNYYGRFETEREERAGTRIRDNLRIIASQGERLSRLVNDVLDLNKIESGMMEWRDELIDPASVLQRAVEATTPLLEGKPGVEFVDDVESGLPQVRLDADRLEQVVINLLHNAVKFTEQGSVRLQAGRDESGDLRVCVEDTGLGIPAHALDEIFDKFHQLPTDALHGKPVGTGLGLFICREIVRHYGGRLWVDSQAGAGSTFTLLLPAASTAPVEA